MYETVNSLATACIEVKKIHKICSPTSTRDFVGDLRERGHLEDLSIDRRVI